MTRRAEGKRRRAARRAELTPRSRGRSVGTGGLGEDRDREMASTKRAGRSHGKEPAANEGRASRDPRQVGGSRGSNRRVGRRGSRTHPIGTDSRKKNQSNSRARETSGTTRSGRLRRGGTGRRRARALVEEITTENFPHLAAEIDIRAQEAQSPKREESTETHGDALIKVSKVKDKERLLNAAREKQLITFKGS